MLRFESVHRRLPLISLPAVALVVASASCTSESGTPGGSGGASSGSGGTSNTGGSAGTAGTGTGGTNTGGTAGGGGTAGSSAGGTSGGSAGTGGGGAGGSGGGSSGGGVVPGTAGYDCDPASGDVPALQATAVVTSGLTQPMVVAHEPDGAAGRLFVLERNGTIRIIENGALVPTAFLDFSSKVAAGQQNGDERGALGMAFHPNYAENGLFYVHYSDVGATNGDSVFEEYKVSADANVADANSGRVVLTVAQPNNGSAIFKNHKGGAINFGADGFLYIGLGDGGGSGDQHGSGPHNNGQNVATLLGKILRIDPELSGSDQYTVPAGNLQDTMASAAPEIWDYGVRNPFRFTFDGCTGDLYIGDVGQDEWEEITIEKVGEGGKNYGWNTMEGTHCYEPATGCDQTGITLPALEFDHDTSGQSVIGGAVYRGSAIAGLRGAYVYADYQSGAVWMTTYNRDTGMASTPVSLTQDLSNVSAVVAINNGADGELYFVSLNGGVYKLEAVP